MMRQSINTDIITERDTSLLVVRRR